VVAAIRVPWAAPSAPRADQLAALAYLPQDAVARGRALHANLRPGTYGALALALILALVLGLTPIGARIVEFVGRPFGGHWIAQALLGAFAVDHQRVADVAGRRPAGVGAMAIRPVHRPGAVIGSFAEGRDHAVIGAMPPVLRCPATQLVVAWLPSRGGSGDRPHFVFGADRAGRQRSPDATGGAGVYLIAMAATTAYSDRRFGDASRTTALNAYARGLGLTRARRLRHPATGAAGGEAVVAHGWSRQEGRLSDAARRSARWPCSLP
jgi:STE24 endopeptidase